MQKQVMRAVTRSLSAIVACSALNFEPVEEIGNCPSRALDLNWSFGWTYHEATTLVALARSQHRRAGSIDEVGRRWLDDAEAISHARGIRMVTAEVNHLRANEGPGR